MLLESTTTTYSFYIVYTGYPNEIDTVSCRETERYVRILLLMLCVHHERVYALWKYCTWKALENAIGIFFFELYQLWINETTSNVNIRSIICSCSFHAFKPRDFIHNLYAKYVLAVSIFLMYSTNTIVHFYTLVNECK